MNATDKQPVNEQRSGIGPGERLQAARIQLGLSLEDVARRMHLSSSILEAIEDNSFEEITAPIFVKGYLRAYARIVSLDEDDMIDQYIDFYSEEDPPISSTSGNLGSELSVADARIKWTTYVVVAVFGILLALWWWNQEENGETTISLDAQPSSIEETANPASDQVSSEIEAGSERLIVTEETAEAVSTQTASMAESAAAPAASPIKQEQAATEVEVAADEVAADEVAADEVAADEVAADEVAADEVAADEVVQTETGVLETVQGTRNQPTLIAPAGTDKLIIVVNADTWADVKDATSYQLVYDLLRADKSVEVMGQAPFSVFLGNGYGVEILFNGEQIDVAPRIRGDNTARLKIGG